ELPGQLHLELALVADHGRRLLHEGLVLALGVLDRLLNLHLRVGVLVDLRPEQRHQVLPSLDERVRHLGSSRLVVYGSAPWEHGQPHPAARHGEYRPTPNLGRPQPTTRATPPMVRAGWRRVTPGL